MGDYLTDDEVNDIYYIIEKIDSVGLTVFIDLDAKPIHLKEYKIDESIVPCLKNLIEYANDKNLNHALSKAIVKFINSHIDRLIDASNRLINLNKISRNKSNATKRGEERKRGIYKWLDENYHIVGNSSTAESTRQLLKIFFMEHDSMKRHVIAWKKIQKNKLSKYENEKFLWSDDPLYEEKRKKFQERSNRLHDAEKSMDNKRKLVSDLINS